ncbi:MAG: DNA replication and repair protein RecF [Spirochaetes bacterium]|nr:DNA replication and repair protein RecF [Spirochaetota bacterium]
MAFLEIETADYRNLEGGAIATGASFVFFIGENGQGKSNILDALYTLCYGSSFRRGTDAEAVCSGKKSWQLKGSLTDRLDEKIEAAAFTDVLNIQWSKKGKSIKENDKPVYDRKYLVERYPAIVFCHEDMDFVQGEPERRRFFFDQTAGLIKASYIDSLRNYKKVLKLRNQALKDRVMDLLDIYDYQLATYGLYLQTERTALVDGFNSTFSDCHERISLLGREVRIEYKSSWKYDTVDQICSQLALNRERDLLLGTSTSGPHRDRYSFIDGPGDYAQRASTGQKRLMSLVLRIAQAEYFTAASGRKPLLLLDDVLLELDPEKRKRFMVNLPEAEQSFFTFLPGEPFRDYIKRDTIVYWTEDGRFTGT